MNKTVTPGTMADLEQDVQNPVFPDGSPEAVVGLTKKINAARLMLAKVLGIKGSETVPSLTGLAGLAVGVINGLSLVSRQQERYVQQLEYQRDTLVDGFNKLENELTRVRAALRRKNFQAAHDAAVVDAVAAAVSKVFGGPVQPHTCAHVIETQFKSRFQGDNSMDRIAAAFERSSGMEPGTLDRSMLPDLVEEMIGDYVAEGAPCRDCPQVRASKAKPSSSGGDDLFVLILVP